MTPVQHPLVPVAPAPLGPPNAPRPGLVAGAGAMLSGLAIIGKTPALWPLALVPVAIGTALTAALSAVAIGWIPGLLARWLGATHVTLGVIAGVLATVIAILFALVVGFGLAQPLSGFALEKIVHHVEASEGVPAWPTTSFLVSFTRSLVSIALSWAFGLPVLALLMIVNVVVPPAIVVTVPLKLVVVALLVAWDLCDYPLSSGDAIYRNKASPRGRLSF